MARVARFCALGAHKHWVILALAARRPRGARHVIILADEQLGELVCGIIGRLEEWMEWAAADLGRGAAFNVGVHDREEADGEAEFHHDACAVAVWTSAHAEYVALLDHEQVGYDMLAFIQLTFSQHTPKLTAGLLKLIESQVRVLECHQITGEADLLLKVITENRQALANVVAQLTECDEVQRVQTSLVLSSSKMTTEISLD